MIKKYLKCYGFLFGMIIILTLILSIINYFTNLPFDTIKIIIPIISMFIASIILGKNTKEKAYLEGIKFSIIYIVISIVIRFIIKMNFNYKTIIIYVILLVIGIIGATLGINYKRG